MSNESLVQLFKARSKPGVSVKVPFPNAEDPALIFEIKRMSPSELRAIESAAFASAAEWELNSRQWFAAFNVGMAIELIKRLPIIGWEVKQEGLPAYDRANAQLFLDSLDAANSMIVAGAYHKALEADEAAASGNEITPAQDSETASSVG